MEEVLHYLDLKNRYLDKFLGLTQKFLEQVHRGKWDEINLFIDNRERILNIIRYFDQKIAKHFDLVELGVAELDTFRPRVKSLLDLRASITRRIINIDLQLISEIDEVKSETVRELKTAVETSHQVETFMENAPAVTASKSSRSA